ncbi:hypothetical protein BHF70_03480 [Anaerostipes sp. 494a]|uniref:DUF1836 domain-containing protein n=1 Tax=Anaerostipes TaxID=207244 RepID=UPI000953506D|nr:MULTISPECIES: DUF1836 domain-containing protein [Anaerostipes]MDY2727378.1 DUF1836 domain-containing protein [Anaerostipes faecalis]OLR58759.1 hypothetical protein BHF70_03480 [Anaerostipes sp. 494a]
MEFENKLEKWMKLDYVLPEDIPNIDLYMDQVTTFLEEQLLNTKRFDTDKIFTKTMINNYSKNQLLPPSYKKKYSKNHIILLIYIYYLKNFLSISDIKSILDPLTEHFYDSKDKNAFYKIYEELYSIEHDHTTAIKQSILDTAQKAQETFSGISEDSEKKFLQQFSFIALLGYDIYLRKQVIEKMIDELYQPEENRKKGEKKKK